MAQLRPFTSVDNFQDIKMLRKLTRIVRISVPTLLWFWIFSQNKTIWIKWFQNLNQMTAFCNPVTNVMTGQANYTNMTSIGESSVPLIKGNYSSWWTDGLLQNAITDKLSEGIYLQVTLSWNYADCCHCPTD